MLKGHEIAMGLRLAYRAMHRQTNEALAPLGVTADQFVVLGLLYQEDGITQQELCQRASSDPNTVRAMLLLLERKGLVDRQPHQSDRRALQVTLNSRGRSAYADMLQAIEPIQEKLAESFGSDSTVSFLTALRRVSDAMS